MQLTKFWNKAYCPTGKKNLLNLQIELVSIVFFGLNVRCSSAHDIQDGKSLSILNHF